MKRILKRFEWIAFAVCLCTLLIYLVYTLYIKLNPSVIITDKLINTLKAYLIIALISLFIGLLIVLIKKIYYLKYNNTTVKTKKVKVVSNEADNIVVTNNKVIIEEKVKEEKYTINNQMKCDECGKIISKDAAICPHCGVLYDKAVLRVLKKYERNKERKERSFSLLGLIINIILIIFFVVLSIILANKIYDKVKDNNYTVFQKQE